MNNVIDFQSRRPKPQNAPPKAAPPADRETAYRVEFFNDDEFPMRFGGATDADQMRDLARRCMDAAFGLLSIAHERDADTSQLLRMMAYVMHDGTVYIDTYEPPGCDGARLRESFDWYLSAVPEIQSTLRRMKADI